MKRATTARRTTPFAERVYALVREVPRGRIVSYGGVAAMLGKPRGARAVGQALRNLPDDNDVPWWRVVNATGAVSARPAINAKPLQQALLKKEKIVFDAKGCADWRKYGWNPSIADRVPPDNPKAGPEKKGKKSVGAQRNKTANPKGGPKNR